MKNRWPLERKIMVLVCTLITIIMLMVTVVYMYFERKQAQDIVGQQALTTAMTVSEIPEVKKVLITNGNASHMREIVEEIRKKSGAEFIVVGDIDGIRYSHPIQEKIGKVMVGGDNDEALVNGNSYVSMAEGSIGESVRGKTPVYSDAGDIIGIVSVGFLLSKVDSTYQEGLIGILLWLLFIFIMGVGGSLILTRNIRKDTFGLEPYQIARIYKERGAVLEAISEGVIATDQFGRVTLINQSAKDILGVTEDDIGRPIQEVLPNSDIAHVLGREEAEGQFETVYQDHQLVVRYKRVGEDGRYGGKVASFQRRSEIQELISTLSEVQQYSHDLRAQTHEYTNKLYAISGWLQLGRTNKALNFIHEETGQQKTYERVLFEQIHDPTIQAILIGKLSKASEKKINFILDETSSIEYEWPQKAASPLVTIIGNIIDNAFEAVSGQAHPEVQVYTTDMADDLIIEVTDNGKGIPPDLLERIHEQGFSTKVGKDRGFGMALVQASLRELNGSLEVSSDEREGTIVTIYIPKGGGAR
ncbi:sensor histidine kinase [Bacillus sp. JRC01]|nr:sensor histidine kinase [Bacillus sp. JRC01]